jgi:surfeit locus 1 family protein
MWPVIVYLRSPRRLILTLLILACGLGMIRLGFWQLDRLKQRKAANAKVLAQLLAPVLDLNLDPTSQSLTDFAYRSVKVNGEYDFSGQVYLKNQVWGNQLGVHLLTPLKISGSSQAVLVDRGWIPFEDAVPGKVEQFDQPGQVTITGFIHLQQSEPTFGGLSDPPLSPGQSRLQSWIVVNIDRIQKQVNYQLLQIYIQQSPGPDDSQLPYQAVSSPDLTDGPHLSYAIQWFSFTAILLIGYPFVVRRQLRSQKQMIRG